MVQRRAPLGWRSLVVEEEEVHLLPECTKDYNVNLHDCKQSVCRKIN